MRILFVLEPRIDAGSIQAVANYILFSDDHEHIFAAYGKPDLNYPNIRFSEDVDSFDHIVFIYESNLYWPRQLQMLRVLAKAPKKKRVVFDADGTYNPLIKIDGYDSNHSNEKERLLWRSHFEAISDKVLQPTLTTPIEKNSVATPFYGYNPDQQREYGSSAKKYDILYLGHNWCRWDVIHKSVLPAIEKISDQIKNGICFIGHWWDTPPEWAKESGFESRFRIDNNWRKRLKIKTLPAVPYTDVISTMSSAKINIMTQRPVLRSLKHLTSKYFEIFCADTIPLFVLDPEHAVQIYGPAGGELALYDKMEEKLLDVIEHPENYVEIVRDVRSHILRYHSYQVRIKELIQSLQT